MPQHPGRSKTGKKTRGHFERKLDLGCVSSFKQHMAASAALIALIGASACVAAQPDDARQDGGEESSQGDAEGELDPERGPEEEQDEPDTDGGEDEDSEQDSDIVELLDLGDMEEAEGGSCEGQQPVPTDTKPDSAPLIIDALSVDGDCLTIDVHYRGCELHAYTAHWGANWTKSFPPQTTLHLSHQLNEGESLECGPVFDSWVVNLDKLRQTIGGDFVLSVGTRSVLVEG